MELNKFKNQIEQVLRSVEKEKHEDLGAESKSYCHHDRYQTIAAKILKHLVEPRMEIVADQFDAASIDVNVDIGYARLSFLHQELPAVIYLLFFLRQDYNTQMIMLYAGSCLKPYILDYEPSEHLAITLDDPDLKRVELFIEKQILKFVKGYLRTQHYVRGQESRPL